MAGTRFVIAGGILYVGMRLWGAERPTLQHWKSGVILGALLLLAGNGGVSWAELTVPSGITALVIAAVPLWILLVDWLRPGGRRPGKLVVVGLMVGFAGVTMIVGSRNSLGGHVVEPIGAVVLLFATLSWAIGSIYSRHAAKPSSALMAIATQMIAGGVLQLIFGALIGELNTFDVGKITSSSAWAFVYLTLIGSLVGFTAYVWLLQVSTPARVSTYAYVNPVIAVLLGSLVLNEAVPQSVAIAGVLVLAAVILITREERR
jgi:drug/metabolite transporter (DMT)-like permease